MIHGHQFVLDRLLDEFGLLVGGGRLTGMLALQARSNGLQAIDSMWSAWLKCSAPSGRSFCGQERAAHESVRHPSRPITTAVTRLLGAFWRHIYNPVFLART